MEGISEEKIKKYSNLSEVLDLIEESLVDVTDQGRTIKRITKPFEARIDKSSVELNSLKRIAKLPIEIGIAQDENGDLILNTGSVRSSTVYDIGPKEEWMNDESLLYGTSLESRHKAHKILQARNRNSPGFTIHNHPSGLLRPSPGDLNYYTNLESKRHFILGKSGVCILNTDFEEEKIKRIKDYSSGAGLQLNYFNKPEHSVFLESLGVIEKVVTFDDPEIETVIMELKK